jgi:uncharacterized coiled-coil protein SlyX
VVLDRVRQLQRRRRVDAQAQEAAVSDAARDGQVQALEARLAQLELALEGLQDAVHRQAIAQDKHVDELRRRTEPEQMARALAEDARRRGL